MDNTLKWTPEVEFWFLFSEVSFFSSDATRLILLKTLIRTMSSSRVRPQQQQLPLKLDSSEGIEMENIQHQEPGLGGVTTGTPSPPSRQAWSRDNPVFEPEDEIMEADWPPASPGRRSVSTASSGGCSSGLGSYSGGASSPHIPRGGVYPSPTLDGQQQERRNHRGCMKQILQKIRSEQLFVFGKVTF